MSDPTHNPTTPFPDQPREQGVHLEQQHHGHLRELSPYIDHVSQAGAAVKPYPDRLFVVTALFNPLRYKSRYEHYRAFEKRVRDLGGILYTVELAFGDRLFECTEPDDPYDIQLRTWSEIWHKETAINIGIQRIIDRHPEWQKVAVVDADVNFARPDIFQETLQQLEHYMILQMFSHAIDLGPTFGPLPRRGDQSEAGQYEGFFYSHATGRAPLTTGDYYYPGWPGRPLAYWHPGFTMAFRREAYEALGGLFEVSIAGNGDHLMCSALVGRAEKALPR